MSVDKTQANTQMIKVNIMNKWANKPIIIEKNNCVLEVKIESGTGNENDKMRWYLNSTLSLKQYIDMKYGPD